MIDWGYEDRLIERVDARRLIRDRLTAQQRTILRDHLRTDGTLAEIGGRHGITRTRVSQVLAACDQKLTGAGVLPVISRRRDRAPPGFDKAAFLRHMQRVIERRARAAEYERELAARLERARLEREADLRRDLFQREREALDSILGVGPEPAPDEDDPKPSLTDIFIKPKPVVVVSTFVVPCPGPVTNVEPWFDPNLMPTQHGMHRIATYALSYFEAIRKSPPGLPQGGTKWTRIVCERDADAIAERMQHLNKWLPPTVRLSAWPMPVEQGALAVSIASPRVAMRVTCQDSGKSVAFDVSWDD